MTARKDKAAVAIGAFDKALISDLEIDPGMTQGAAAAITGDTVFADGQGFGCVDAHAFISVRELAPDHSGRSPYRNWYVGHNMQAP